MNTIEKAIRYLNEPSAIRNVLNESLRTKDLETECVFVGAQTVKYQHIGFGSYRMGDYDREHGYSRNDISLTWKELVLTQDKGDSLMIDKMDDEESTANGIVRIGNRYIDKVQNPALDTYRLSMLAKTKYTAVVNATLTAENVLSSILSGKALLEEMKVDTTSLLLYITPEAKAILKAAALKNGYWAVGSWNNVVDANIETFDGCKVIPVPSSYFGDAAVQAILVHKDAAPAMVKYQETVYHDTIPGHGKRTAMLDMGVYHDAFVYDELTRAVCLFLKTTAATKTVTYEKGDAASSAKEAPTQAAAKPGDTFLVAANPFDDYKDKSFAGWSDGHNLYQPGATYVVPNNDVTLTAVWH